MSTTFPFEHNGVEYIADVVDAGSTNNDHIHQVDYYIKINGDDASFVHFKRNEHSIFSEHSSSPDISSSMKETIKSALINVLLIH